MEWWLTHTRTLRKGVQYTGELGFSHLEYTFYRRRLKRAESLHEINGLTPSPRLRCCVLCVIYCCLVSRSVLSLSPRSVSQLTHGVMNKELKACKNPEDLECNENVKHKTKEYIKKYMQRFGSVYRPKEDTDVY